MADRPKGTIQPTYVTKQDRELEGKGVSWKADVRDRLSCALRVSATEDEFLEACRALGLGVRRSAARKGGGDWVYAHPGKDTWQVSGARLGRDWSRWGIQRRLASDRTRGVEKPAGAVRDRLLGAVGSLEKADGAVAMQVIGTTRGIGVTAADTTSMLDVCSRMDIRSMADLKAALREPMAPKERAQLRNAMTLARALGYLPRERDRVDGVRSTYEERMAFAARKSDVVDMVSSDGRTSVPAVRDGLDDGHVRATPQRHR